MLYTRDLSTLDRDDLDQAGGKGANLGELVAAGLPVPDGFVLTTAAYTEFVTSNGLQPRIEELVAAGDPEAAADAIARMFREGELSSALQTSLRGAYARLGADVAVAVRSSATAEDLAEASFAGQQETFLNVRTDSALLQAVRDCWASLWSPRAIAYRAAHRVTGELALAVVVQRLVEARSAGVMFTANPTTGRTDETVISAAWGLGESVVSGSVSTDDLVLRAGRVIERRIASKQTRTVPAAAGVRTEVTPAAQRDAAVLDDGAAGALAALGRRAAEHFGTPQDLEWVIDTDGTPWLVQSRPITALPEETGDAPTEWPAPARHDVFMRASITEQLPNPLSTLFADLAEKLVVPGMIGTINDFFGPQKFFTAKDISFVTINGFGYYGYGNSLFLKALPVLPLAGRLIFSQLGRQRWEQVFQPRYAEVVRRRRTQDPAGLTAAALLAGIEELVGAGFAYYTSVQTIIPEAVTSELLFTGFYDRVVKRPGDPRAEDFLLGLDSAPLRADQSVYELARWAAERPALAAALGRTEVELGDAAPAGVDEAEWAEFRRLFDAHLDRFGHAVYNLDLLNPVAADNPAPVLDALRFYLSGTDASPVQRRNRLATNRKAAIDQVLGRLRGTRRALFQRLLQNANEMGPVREDSLADIGLGWPTARAYAAELGGRLVRAGVLEEADDVHWLRLAELERAAAELDAGRTPRPAQQEVAERRREWRGRRRVTPPAIVPDRSLWHVWDNFMPSVMGDQSGAVLRGTGASGGRVTGTARVVHGPEDFSGMQPGEILVAAITTPAWTPLFALAAGVVTDIGGPLSHSSIVAREYAIPAVLGTTVATARIRTGDRLALDGEAGTVTLLDEQQPESAPVQRKRGTVRKVALAAGAATALLIGIRSLRSSSS
ncbi:phosphoenolpyruvate synthase [Enemella evansiae]|uniref:Phosphoenolpyruvate synthase n=1 Tax=Enemella evansiae TaxID=2016499 RepID=A0A255GK90_9ACTN|nr:PEP/pyruvate-binding domain-containing protein [Enemella evansiae]OYO13384.1 phosphoenolpyruvate synthase [Enemella evansiae]